MHREGEGIRLFQNLVNYLSLDMTSYPRAVLFNRWCAKGRLLIRDIVWELCNIFHNSISKMLIALINCFNMFKGKEKHV
jgi:hypothetical protein